MCLVTAADFKQYVARGRHCLDVEKTRKRRQKRRILSENSYLIKLYHTVSNVWLKKMSENYSNYSNANKVLKMEGRTLSIILVIFRIFMATSAGLEKKYLKIDEKPL